MPALITTILPPRSYELIRNRLGEIITVELANQVTLAPVANADINAKVWSERFVKFDKVATPAVNIMLAQGDYDGQTVKQYDGTYTFYLDCYASAKTTATAAGDTTAMLAMQKLAGVVGAIIQVSQYITLGFTAPFIWARQVKALAIALPQTEDATSVCQGRLTVTVKAPETVPVKVLEELAGNTTKVTLNSGPQGFYYDLTTSY